MVNELNQNQIKSCIDVKLADRYRSLYTVTQRDYIIIQHLNVMVRHQLTLATSKFLGGREREHALTFPLMCAFNPLLPQHPGFS